MEEVAKDHKLNNRRQQFGVWITEDMTRRITYDHGTITYLPSGKTHSGDRVCVRAAEVVKREEIDVFSWQCRTRIS